MQKKTYKELALEFKNTKSEKSFNQLYKKIKPGIWNYIYKIVKDRAAADDITSTTLTTIYLKIDQYNEDYQITTWAYKIAYNECIGWLRQSSKKVSMSIFTDAGIDPTVHMQKFNEDTNELKTEDDFINEDNLIYERAELIKDAITSLPIMYKPYMIERFLNHKSYNEILNMMINQESGINLQTVKNRIFRGRKLIKQQLDKNKAFLNI